jgi:hypothetical protein
MKRRTGKVGGIFGSSGFGALNVGIFAGPTALGTALGDIVCQEGQAPNEDYTACVDASTTTPPDLHCDCGAAPPDYLSCLPCPAKIPAPPAGYVAPKAPASMTVPKTGTPTSVVKPASGGGLSAILAATTFGLPNLALLAAGGLLLGVGVAIIVRRQQQSYGV